MIIKNIFNWLGQNLLHHNSLGAYFEPVIQLVKPAWRVGFYRARVQSTQKLSDDVISVWLKVDQSWPVHKAGQHIELTIEINGRLTTRVFTIASSPLEALEKQVLRLVIKQQALGNLTPHLNELKSGAWLNISEPKGYFTLEKIKKGSVFLAAGSGITPFISILSEIFASEQKSQNIHLIYYAKPNEHLLVDELNSLSKRRENFTFELLNRKNDGDVHTHLVGCDDSDLFVCGPAAFYRSVATFADEHGNKLLSEHFSALPIETATKASFNLFFRGRNRAVNNSSPLLNQLLEQGEQVTFGCKMGICHQCQCTKMKGQVKNIITGKISDTGEEIIQLCTSQVVTNLELKA